MIRVTTQRQSWWVLAIGILLIAAALRFHHLGRASLWYDEGNSWVQATRNPAAIAAHTARDIHPPGYYWLLAGCRSLLGESEFALRLPSAWASVLTAACLIAAGRQLGNGRAGIAAGLLFALNSFPLDYAQQVRMYALHAMWGAALLLLSHAYGKRPTRKRWFALALVNAAGLWTHYSFAFVILAQAFWLLWLARSDWRQWLREGISLYALTALLYLPWLAPAYRSVTGWPNTGETTSLLQSLREMFRAFSVGSAAEFSPLFAAAIAASTALVLLPWLRQWRQSQASIRAVLPWFLLPITLFLLLGLYRPANVKFLLPAQAAFALFLALGLADGWRRHPGWALLAASPLFAGLLLGASDHFEGAPLRRADYRAAIAAIHREVQAQPAIPAALILNGPGQQEVFSYYDARLAPALSSLLAVRPLPAGNGPETVDQTHQLLQSHQRIYALFWGETERDPQQWVERILASDGFLAAAEWFGDLRLSRYAAPNEALVSQEFQTTFQHPNRNENLTLLGHSLLARDAWQPGEWVPLELRWQTSAPIHSRYRIFSQLLYPDGTLAITQDSEPGGNLLPTTSWPLAQTIVDRHALPLPLDLPPGDYPLIVGVYPLGQPNERWITDDGDFLHLTTLKISPP
ncbi:MAG: glycosyltransferase family 39 protein [Chloroflexi bacterium]|nr:glycosyltransferase family 39 protein [Chloroflexota bacterium]